RSTALSVIRSRVSASPSARAFISYLRFRSDIGVRPILTDPPAGATFSRDTHVRRKELTMATVIGPNDGAAGFLGSIGVRFMIDGEDAGGDFSLVEHPLSPRALAAPLHRHT